MALPVSLRWVFLVLEGAGGLWTKAAAFYRRELLLSLEPGLSIHPFTSNPFHEQICPDVQGVRLSR